MDIFSLPNDESRILQHSEIKRMLPSLWRNPNVVFATQQQLRAEQSAHRVKEFFYLSKDNYAIIRC